MADRDEFRRPSERDSDADGGDLGRVVPGRRTLTQTIGGAAGAGAAAAPGKISLTHRLPSASPMTLPYRGEMESGFGQDFSGVSASVTTREALGGAGGMAQGESVAFAGTPAKETVAHELAHVVQHRQGLTSEAHADNDKGVLDVWANHMAKQLTAYNTGRAKLPRPIVLEVVGDRFTVTAETNNKNELVLLAHYDGPYEVGGDYVENRTIRIPATRVDTQSGAALDVKVLEVHDRGVRFDLTGAGLEIAELTFDPRPHAEDPDARTHWIKTKTSNVEGSRYRMHILLPNQERPAPAGMDEKEVERERSSSLQVTLGPDAFTLTARRLGESKNVGLYFAGVGALRAGQYGDAALTIPIQSADASIKLAVLAQSEREIQLDLDGDGKLDARLVYTAKVGTAKPDGSQTHTHYVDAYDPDQVKVAKTWFQVSGQTWEVPASLDRDKTPPPDSAAAPVGQAPAQGNLPTEAAKPIQVAGGDWELRIDGDGDRQKELLLRFHQTDWGKPVTITIIQISTKQSSSFTTPAWENNEPSQMEPELTQATDGLSDVMIRLFPARTAGLKVHLHMAPPVVDGLDRVYTFTVRSPSVDDQVHTARFPKEEQKANPLLEDPKSGDTVAGIQQMTARLGELGDPFLFALEKSPGGWTLGIGGVNQDGSVTATSGHRLSPLVPKAFKVLEITPSAAFIDLTGDDRPDIVIRDAISQPLGRDSSPQLTVERQHVLRVGGPAVQGEADHAIFTIRGRTFVPSSLGAVDGREGAGAAGSVVAIQGQRQEGADISQLIGRFRSGVSAQILKAGERGFISKEMVSAWKSLAEEMIRLDAYRQVPADKKAQVADSEKAVRASASEHAATLYNELVKETAKEPAKKVYDKDMPAEAEQFKEYNPYSGEEVKYTGKEFEGGRYDESWQVIAPGPAATLSMAIAKGLDPQAAVLWANLQDGVERWAQKRLEQQLGDKDPTVRQGKYMSAMAGKLTEIQNKNNIQRVYATFTADEMYRGEKDFYPVTQLMLWAWQADDGEWKLRDLTNPEKPFDSPWTAPEYRRVDKAGDRPRHNPPHHLFLHLNDKKKFPKGLIRYEIPGTSHHNFVRCDANKKWYEYVQDVGLALAAVGLILVTAGVGTVAVVGSYVLAASAIAGAVAAGGEMVDAYEHGWLDGMVIAVNLLQIASSVASAGSIVAGNLVRGARAASAAVEAGEKGAALWSGRLAKLASMADKAYVPLTAGALGSDIVSVVVMGVDLRNKLKEIDDSGLSKEQANEAKAKLLAMFALTGGLTVLSIKGDLPQIKGHGSAGPTIVLDQVNGVPVAYAGGVRAGKVDINVSPRIGPDGKPVVDPNMHASARWQTREAPVHGLNEDEMAWYRAWMEKPDKVTFQPNGQPKVNMPDLGRPPPAGLEDKFNAMLKNTDIAIYDKAWARNKDLDAVREANGGHLDIDPTSPAWPTERGKIKEKLVDSLGSRKKAEEVLASYEAMRTGARGPGGALHADQAAKLAQVVPPGELDHLRRMFPECEIYVTGNALGASTTEAVKSIEVIVVVPRGTAPDLQAAIEMRVSGSSLRPDPDYAKAHGMGTNDSLPVKAKAVTHEQLFGLSAARVPGRAPIELHRIDVPTGPGGRPYTAGELDTMNKAGYEFDPATGQFAARPAQSRAPLAGSAFGHLRGPNTTVGGALPSEALGEEVLRKLASGEADVLRAVGVEPSIGFDPRKNEWGLAQRQSDKAWVLVQGASGEIDWTKLPGLKPRGHSHPLTDPYTGKVRQLTGEGGTDWVTIDQLAAGKGGNSMMYLSPSGSDFAVAATEGKHMVATPFVHLGGGKIGSPRPGGTDPIVEFEILSARPDGLVDQTQLMLYRAEVRIRAGGETLYEGPMWGFQTNTFSDVRFKRPEKVGEVPKDFVVGEWAYKQGGGGTTATASVKLEQRLIDSGLPGSSDPDMARVLGQIDARTEADLHHLLDLQATGQVKGLNDWYKGLAAEPSPDRIHNMMAELREARRLADENPGAIIDLGADARAPNKWKNGVQTGDKDKSFDIEVTPAGGGPVAWSSEIKTIQKPIQDPPDITDAINNAALKVESRSVNPSGAIPGKKEVRIEISLFQGEIAMGGTARIVYDGAGKSTKYKNATELIPGNARKPNPANMFELVADNLNIPGSNSKFLDRVTLVDSTGILARYDKVGNTWTRVQ